ncbi:hypothetical protein AcW1_009494 [Taiwanofungus camphoratus]|nr:hypothetical protein AcW1_009494 [Antrodia cinnamomea]
MLSKKGPLAAISSNSVSLPSYARLSPTNKSSWLPYRETIVQWLRCWLLMRSLCRISYKGPLERRISFFTPVDLHTASPTSPHSTVYRAYDLYNLLHSTSTKPSRHSTTLVARSQDSMQLRIFALLTVSTAALFSGVQAQNYQCPNNAGYSLCCQSFSGSSASGCNSLYPGPVSASVTLVSDRTALAPLCV